MELLDKVIEVLSSVSPMVFTVLVFVVETALRFVKSEKPLSIIYMIAGVLKKLGVVFTKLGEIADKVLPQKVK